MYVCIYVCLYTHTHIYTYISLLIYESRSHSAPTLSATSLGPFPVRSVSGPAAAMHFRGNPWAPLRYYA